MMQGREWGSSVKLYGMHRKQATKENMVGRLGVHHSFVVANMVFKERRRQAHESEGSLPQMNIRDAEPRTERSIMKCS